MTEWVRVGSRSTVEYQIMKHDRADVDFVDGWTLIPYWQGSLVAYKDLASAKIAAEALEAREPECEFRILETTTIKEAIAHKTV